MYDKISLRSSYNEKCFIQSRRENQNTVHIQYIFPLKSFQCCNNVEKYGTARKATDNNTLWHMRLARWINKADAYSEYVILITCLR